MTSARKSELDRVAEEAALDAALDKLADAERRLAESEADRAARLELIHARDRLLADLTGAVARIDTLASENAACRADCARALQAIEELRNAMAAVDAKHAQSVARLASEMKAGHDASRGEFENVGARIGAIESRLSRGFVARLRAAFLGE
ncbi:MAG: hypothetical protein JNM94_15265 [Phycisphaerae bacterium]|nr:hypothetical protein [Phycisphaerae bacterium]